MMKRYIPLLALLLASILYSQSKFDINNLIDRGGLKYAPNDDEPYTGSVFDLYKNGQKKLDGRYKEGLINGVWTYYHENGQKNYEGTCKDGKKDGLWTHWHENGQKEYEGTYKDGQLNGIWNGWYSNGNNRFTSRLKDNVKIGECTYWYDNGVKKTTGNYKNKKSNYQGEKNDIFFKIPFFTNNLSNLFVEPTVTIGTSSHYNWVNGKISSGIEFIHSDRFILKFYWNENGKVLVRNGNGKVVKWYQNGQKKIEGEYKNGKPNGLFIWWNQNGQKKYQVVIIGIKESYFIKEGNWISWNRNGQKSKEGTYQDNMKVGKWTTWHENGQNKSEGTYKDGELISSKCWDEDGNECECGWEGCK